MQLNLNVGQVRPKRQTAGNLGENVNIAASSEKLTKKADILRNYKTRK